MVSESTLREAIRATYIDDAKQPQTEDKRKQAESESLLSLNSPGHHGGLRNLRTNKRVCKHTSLCASGSLSYVERDDIRLIRTIISR